jgi:O-antigen/teichoic acid export membrane protein
MERDDHAHTRSSVFSSLLKGTALYTITMFGQRLAGPILVPIKTHFLTTSDFGVLDLLQKVSSLLSVLLGLHISAALGYFYFEKESVEERRKVASTTILGTTLVGIIAAILGLSLLNPLSTMIFHSPGVRPYLILIFAFFPLSFAVEALFAWLRVVDRPGIFSLASMISVGVTVVATVVLLVVFHMRIMGVLVSAIAAAVSVAVMLAIYCFREIPLQFDGAIFRRIFRFAIPLSLGSIAMFIIHFGDSFILPQYRSFAELGIYSLAYQIGMLVSMLSAAFNTYWGAQAFNVARRSDAHAVISRIFTYLILMLSFGSVGLIVACRPVLRILVHPSFLPAIPLVPLIVLAYLIRSIAEFFQRFFVVEGRPGYDAICNWTGAGVCLAGYFILIPRYGMWGAATATILSFTTLAIISIVWTYRVRGFQLDGVRVGKIAAIALFLVGLYYLVPVSSLGLEIVWSTLLIVAFPGLLWIWRFPEAAEIGKVQSMMSEGFRRGQAFVSAARSRG